jgi:hypothetical protein
MSWNASAAVKRLLKESQGVPLTPVAKCLLYTLADYHNDELGFAFPSVKRLSDESLMSERTAQYHLRDLSKRGVLTIEQRKQKTSLYRFTPFVMGAESAPSGCKATSVEGATATAPEPIEEQTKNKVLAFLADQYRTTFNKPTWTLTPLRRDKALSRLAECLKQSKGSMHSAVGMMVAAMKGLRASDFHMGNNDRKTLYIDWEKQLYGSQEKTEKWIELGFPLIQKKIEQSQKVQAIDALAEMKARRAKK